jgi:hypothetical protein
MGEREREGEKCGISHIRSIKAALLLRLMRKSVRTRPDEGKGKHDAKTGWR